MRMILAPLVKFASKLSHNPLTQNAAEMSAAFSIIVPRRLETAPAIYGGIVSSAITRMSPTARIVITTLSAIMHVSA